LKKKLREFEEAGFVISKEEKSIHVAESIRFMRDVIKAKKWQMNVLENGLSLDLKEIPRKYAEGNNMLAVKNMGVPHEKVEEWQKGGYVEKLKEPVWCCNPMSVAEKIQSDQGRDEVKVMHRLEQAREQVNESESCKDGRPIASGRAYC
jgi:hypothetical protein